MKCTTGEILLRGLRTKLLAARFRPHLRYRAFKPHTTSGTAAEFVMKGAIGEIIFPLSAQVTTAAERREDLRSNVFRKPARETEVEVSHEECDWLEILSK